MCCMYVRMQVHASMLMHVETRAEYWVSFLYHSLSCAFNMGLPLIWDLSLNLKLTFPTRLADQPVLMIHLPPTIARVTCIHSHAQLILWVLGI